MLKYVKPSTDLEEQRRLKFFMEYRKQLPDTKDEEKREETRSFYTDSFNGVCAFLTLFLILCAGALIVYVLSVDKTYPEKLNDEIYDRYHN